MDDSWLSEGVNHLSHPQGTHFYWTREVISNHWVIDFKSAEDLVFFSLENAIGITGVILSWTGREHKVTMPEITLYNDYME